MSALGRQSPHGVVAYLIWRGGLLDMSARSFIDSGRRSGRLLILAIVRLGEFDGEEGLDAGVQIEGFAGPAGSDGAGIGMVEAIHSS